MLRQMAALQSVDRQLWVESRRQRQPRPGALVAHTYMPKTGGTIDACNVDDGMSFMLALQRVRSEQDW